MAVFQLVDEKSFPNRSVFTVVTITKVEIRIAQVEFFRLGEDGIAFCLLSDHLQQANHPSQDSADSDRGYCD